MGIIKKTLAILAPEVTVTGDDNEFSEEVYDSLDITPEKYKPSWVMVEVTAQDEGLLEPTVSAYSRITIGSLWDRFNLMERDFINNSADPVIPRPEGSTIPPYDFVIRDIVKSMSYYGYINLELETFGHGMGYICNSLYNAGIISDIGVRLNELLVEGTSAELYHGPA